MLYTISTVGADSGPIQDDYKALCKTTCEDLTIPASHTADLPSSPTLPSASLPESDQPWETVGPFKAQYHASGLFSTIYRSTLPAPDGASSTSQAIAIKLTTPRRMGAPHDSEREARLLKLAQQAAEDGPSCVIPLLSTQWIAGGHFCLIFPFLPFDLGRLLDGGLLKPAQVRSHLFSLFAALAHIHALGIIHRDVKPSNLMLAGPDGPAYLADFGISWRADDPASEPADAKITDVGTTSYRAPEVLFGFAGYGTKLDMWAAGCVVAECLNAGKPLFDAGDLGSELALLASMFRTIGTPSNETWPEAKTFPDWGKMEFRKHEPRSWANILPDADDSGRDLVGDLVTYESTDRVAADKVSYHIARGPGYGLIARRHLSTLSLETCRGKDSIIQRTNASFNLPPSTKDICPLFPSRPPAQCPAAPALRASDRDTRPARRRIPRGPCTSRHRRPSYAKR